VKEFSRKRSLPEILSWYLPGRSEENHRETHMYESRVLPLLQFIICKGMNRMHLSHNHVNFLALVNTVMKCQDSVKGMESLE
jgi:hypothetical protein